ncbi:MAG: TIR domain-containing protein [Bacilli bacterium]|nr:TIR domain-containing protein [Bacilli bacterium]
MAVYKCKMCGGTIEVTEGQNVVTCEFCGATQTVHSFDNEKKNTYFKRAETLRFRCEFDKAAGIYETIVSEFPREAEAYWGLVLCKYGIEYVDDPKTGLKIPTCHRTRFESIYEDTDYKNVIKHADVVARGVYEKEAKEISKLQKSILDISSKEEPFDIFVCYKETDRSGDRTPDSVLAQDIYKELTHEGYRVFFSRITLEDKLGTQYEPYIFAALHSSKVMIHVTTSDENSESVWVKNEWQRYLSLIQEGQKKVLIPCYKGITAYELPDEMQNLQGQDMSKLGSMQDLVRGVNKILGKHRKAAYIDPYDVEKSAGQDAFDSQVNKGYVYLSKEMWEEAEETFHDATKLVPLCGRAYIGLMLARAQAGSIDDLLEFNGYEAKALTMLSIAKSFADKKCLEEIEEINKKISELRYKEDKDSLLYKLSHRYWDDAMEIISQQTDEKHKIEFEDLYKEALYKESCIDLEAINSVKEVGLFERLIRDFTWLGDYKDSKDKLQVCAEKKQTISDAYDVSCLGLLALPLVPNPTLSDICRVADKIGRNRTQAFNPQPFGKDFKEKAANIEDSGIKYIASKSLNLISSFTTVQQCQTLRTTLKSLKRDNDFNNVYKSINEKEQNIKEVNAAIKRKKTIKGLKIGGIVLAACAVITGVVFGVKGIVDAVNRSNTYKSALAAMESGEYDDAIAYYQSLGSYKDSQNKIEVCNGLKQLEASIETKKESDAIRGIKTIVSAGEPVDVAYSLNGNVKRNSLVKSFPETSVRDTIDKVDFELYKPSENGYTFSHWQSKSVVYWNGTTNLSLLSNWFLNYYTITYNLDDGQNDVRNPSKYSIETDTFNIYPATKYGYTFKGWKDSNQNVVEKIEGGSSGNITLNATWEINHYTVVFKNYDGYELYRTTCDHGGSVAYDGPTPTKPTDSQYSYTFSGWDGSLTNITSDKIFTAQFSNSTNSYRVTFKNYDGSVLQEMNVLYGGSAVYSGATPTKPNSQDDLFGYVFAGWDTDVSYITGETIVTATYNTVNRYLATFNNYNGNTLYSARFNSGTTPVYVGSTPDKPADAQYTYTFNGWNPSLTGITQDTIYTAQYASELNYYLVRFLGYDGVTVLETQHVAYGAHASYSGATPTMPKTQQYTYSFSGWNKDPNSTLITQDTDFVAQFDSTINQYTITFLNYDGTSLGTSTVNYGTNASYTGPTPTRVSDSRGYVFDNKWTTTNGGLQYDDLSNVVANRTVYAAYSVEGYKKISANFDSTNDSRNVAMLTNSGRVFMFGTSHSGECGDRVFNNVTSQYTPINGNEITIDGETFVDVEVTTNKVYFVTSSGNVYYTGRYDDDQAIYTLTPMIIPNPNNYHIVRVISSDNYVRNMYALDTEGNIYYWNQMTGYANVKILEFYTADHLRFKDVVRCGPLGLAGLTLDGDIYGWGYNGQQQMPLTSNYNNQYVATPLRFSDGTTKFSKITGGYHNLAAITTDGVLYMSGVTGGNGMKIGDAASNTSESFVSTGIQGVHDVALGREHGILVKDLNYDGKGGYKVYTWGDNRLYGACGVSDTSSGWPGFTEIDYSLLVKDNFKYSEYQYINENNDDIKVFAGDYMSYLITNRKHLVAWGRDHAYCLGNDVNSSFTIDSTTKTPSYSKYRE